MSDAATRFDRLLAAMVGGEAPSARRKRAAGPASDAEQSMFQRYSNSPRYFGRCFGLTWM